MKNPAAPPAKSETVAEKPRRGRPPLMSPASRSTVRLMNPEVKSERGLANAYYRTVAASVLWQTDAIADLAWLIGTKEECAAGRGAFRMTILQELGRLHLDDIPAVARIICEQKPTSKRAVATIRSMRLGKTPESDAFDLTSRILAAIDSYVDTHAGTSWDCVIAALHNALDAVENLRQRQANEEDKST